MANMFTYLSNIGKSIKYSTIDVVKDMNPAIKTFKEDNADVSKSIYNTIKQVKSNGVSNELKSNKYVSLVNTAFSNAKEDLKTGKLYNLEREKQAEEKAMAKYMGGFGDDDFGFFDDDSDFDFSSDDSYEPSNSATNDMMDIVAKKSTEAISNTVFTSAEYISGTSQKNTKVLYDQQNILFGKLHSDLGTMNINLTELVNFAKDGIGIHMENSKTFYEASTALSKERNDMLKEILEIQRNIYKSQSATSSKSDKIGYGDIVNDGIPDLGKYMKALKQKAKNSGSGMFEMLDMFMDMGMGDTLAASPLKALSNAAVKKVIGKTIESSVKDFNKTLSGVFGSMILKFNDMANDYTGGISQKIGEILGLDIDSKKSLNTSGYKKGAVPFDGITRKSIVEVIPTYLSKILTAVSESPETRYDYENGKFVKLKNIQDELDNISKTRSRMASYDIRSYIDEYKKEIEFQTKADKEQFEKDIEAIMDKSYRDAKVFNPRKDNISAATYGLKGGKKSDINIALFKEMWEKIPYNVRMQYAGEILSNKESETSEMRRREEEGSDILTNIFNDSVKAFKTTSSTKESAVAGGKFGSNPVLGILNDIKKELAYIRTYGLPGGNVYGKNKKSRPSFDNFKEDSLSKNANNEDNTFYQWNNKDAIKYDETIDPETYAKIVSGKIDKTKSLKDEEANKSIFGKIAKSSSAGETTKLIANNINDLLKRPVDFLNTVITKADKSVYELIYGKEDGSSDKGVLSEMTSGLKNAFSKFDQWLDETILKPLSQKLTKENIHNAAKRLFSVFGVDLDDLVDKTKTFLFGTKNDEGVRTEKGLLGGIIDGVKSNFSEIGKWIKGSFKSVFNWFGFGKKDKASNKDDSSGYNPFKASEKMDEYRRRKSEREDYNNSNKGYRTSRAMDIASAFGADIDQMQYATGTRRVDRTGVAVVSEGEMIVPPDMNPFNIIKRRKEESKAAKNFKSFFGIPSYAEGTTNAEPSGTGEPHKETEESFFSRMGEEIHKFADFLHNLVGDIKTKANGKVDEKAQKSQFGKITKDVLSNIKEYAPDMVTGGLIGGGVSLLTGMIGGPLLGAAAGASIALVKDSNVVRDWLFGKIGKDGDREGGIISKDLTKNISKYLPTMAKGATVGAITSIIPFVPGGPVAGLILGSAAGFAMKNEKIQDALFGVKDEEGNRKGGPLSGVQDKVKKMLPRMGLGAIAGLVAGPFGVTTNILLGSALGFATDTNKFKDIFFGEEDANGNRAGGIYGVITDTISGPLKKYFDSTLVEIKDWFKKDIRDPLSRSIDPLKRQIQLGLRNIEDHFKNKVSNFFDKTVGAPMEKFLKKKVLEPLGKLIGGIISPVKGIAKGVVSAPFKAIGYLGDKAKLKQVRSGGANYMTAAERIMYRDEKGGLGRQDQFEEADSIIAGMSKEELETALKGTKYAANVKSNANKDIKSASKVLKNTLFKDDEISYKASKTIFKLAQKGEVDKALNYIRRLNISEDKKQELYDQVSKEATKIQDAMKYNSDIEGTQNSMFETLHKMGFKNIDKSNVRNYEDLFKTELDAINGQTTKERDSREEVREKVGEKRHKEIINTIEEAVQELKKLNNPKYAESSEYKTYEEEKNKPIPETFAEKAAKKAGEAADTVKTTANNAKNKASKYVGKLASALALSSAFMKTVYADVTADGNDDEETVNFLDKLKGVGSKAKKTFTQFYNGLPIRYVKGKDGKDHVDKSDSETKETLKKQSEEQETQKGIFNKISEMPGKILSFFGGHKDEKDEKKNNNIFSSIMKKVGLAVGISTLIGFLPKFYNFYKEKIKPIFSEFFSDVKSGFTGAITNGTQTLGEKIGEGAKTLFTNVKDFFASEGEFKDKGFTYYLREKIIPFYLEGFEFTMSKVVPKMAEIIVTALPNILKGINNGIGNLLQGLVNQLRGHKDPDSLYNLIDSSDNKVTVPSVDVKTSGVIKYSPSSAWNTKTVTIDGGVKNVDVDLGEGETKQLTDNVTMYGASANDSGVFKDPTKGNTPSIVDSLQRSSIISSNKLPKAFSNVAENQSKKALDSYGKVKGNVVSVNGKVMTIADLLDSDLIVAQMQDDQGNVIDVKGSEILMYPELAEKFGIDSKLTDKEREAQTKKLGLNIDDKTPLAMGGEAAVRSFLRGSSPKGITKGLSNFAKGAKTVPGKALNFATSAISKVTGAAGNLGAKVLPEWMVGTDNKKAAEASKGVFSKTAEFAKGVYNDNKDNVKNAVKGSSIVKKFENSYAGELFKKFTDKVKSLIEKLFKNDKVQWLIKKIMPSEKIGKKAVTEVIEDFGTRIAVKIADKLGQTAGEAVIKATTKISAFVGTGGVAIVGQAILDFVSGFNNADATIGVYDPSAVTRIICGAANALNGTLCLGLIPLDLLFELILPIAREVFKIDTTELDKQREEVAKDTAQWNLEHGTDLTEQEFLMKDKMSTKIKNAAGKVWNTVKHPVESIKGGAKWVGNKVSGVTDKIANSKAGQWVGDKLEGAKEGLNKAGNWIGEKVTGAKDSVVDFGKSFISSAKASLDYALGKSETNAADSLKEQKDGVDAGYTKAFASVTDTLFAPVAGVVKVGKYIGNAASNVFKFVSDIAVRVKNDFTSGIKDAYNLDMGSYFSINTSEDTGNPLGGFRSFIKGATRILTTPIALLAFGGGALVKSATTLIDKVKSGWAVISNIGNTAIDQATSGDISSFFSLQSTDDEGNPVGWLNKVLEIGTKVVLAPVVGISWAGSKIKSGIETVASKIKAAINFVGGIAGTNFKHAIAADNSFFNKQEQGDESSPVSWIGEALDISTKVLLYPVFGISKIGHGIQSAIGGLVSGAQKVMSNISTDINYTSSYFKKDSLDGFWSTKNKSKDDDLIGKIGNAAITIHKVLSFPVAVISTTINKVIEGVKGIIDAIKEKVKSIGDWIGKGVDGLKNFFSFDWLKDINMGDSASGSGINIKRFSAGASNINNGFVSQLDSRYANKTFNTIRDNTKQTIASSGCGPAAATMAINDTMSNDKAMTMSRASSLALRYKTQNGGVSADYFSDIFKRQGISTRYIDDEDPNKRSKNILSKLVDGDNVILMGQDPNNRTKAASPFGPNPHYVVATGLSRDGKYINIKDPESNKPSVYSTSRVLSATNLGVDAYVASGSGLIGRIRNKLKKYTGMATALPGNSSREKIWNYLRTKGFTDQAAAAIIGNMMQEAGTDVDPNLHQRGGPGRGIIQWEIGSDRFAGLEQKAASLGTQWSDLYAQLEWFWHEFNNEATWKYYLKKNGYTPESFAQRTDLEGATQDFCSWFERAGTPMMSNRIKYAQQTYNEFSGKFTQVTGDVTSGGTTATTGSAEQEGTFLDKILGSFDKLGAALGLTTASTTASTSTSSSSSISTDGISGTVSSNPQFAAKQKELVAKMKSMEGTLKYCQDNAKYPGSRNPETGGGDCSSTVQYVYQKVLGVDPGSWTGAQAEDSDTYTVDAPKLSRQFNESSLQLGDLLLYGGNAGNHVEMYMGNGQMIGHGGGNGGKTPGPTVKPISSRTKDPWVARRWVGFKGGSGSGLLDTNSSLSKYINKSSEDIKPVDNVGFGDLYNAAIRYTGGAEASDLPDVGNFTNKSITKRNGNVNITYENNMQKGDNSSIVELVKSIIGILSKLVDNTNYLQTVVALLTKIIDLNSNGQMNEETRKTTSSLLKSTMANMLNNQGSGNNKELDTLIKNIQAIASE